MRREAIVLAGGFGTRLQSVVSDVPKPMAPVAGKPFLHHVLHTLAQQGYTHIAMATGYKHEVIEHHFGSQFEGMQLRYSVEDHPLGTGGAILGAMPLCECESQTVLNGDTYFAADLAQLRRFATSHHTDLAVVLRKVDDAGRYGAVETNADGRITRFREKDPSYGPGLINGGIYQLNRSIFDGYAPGDTFSFEKDIMQHLYTGQPFYAYADDGYFIDIGIPDDYARAQTELPTL